MTREWDVRLLCDSLFLRDAENIHLLSSKREPWQTQVIFTSQIFTFWTNELLTGIWVRGFKIRNGLKTVVSSAHPSTDDRPQKLEIYSSAHSLQPAQQIEVYRPGGLSIFQQLSWSLLLIDGWGCLRVFFVAWLLWDRRSAVSTDFMLLGSEGFSVFQGLYEGILCCLLPALMIFPEE